jgi:glycosyltransferase involved in cell wall biosynthesis
MNLALVIPVWNDQGGLIRLLKQAQSLGIFDEIVVVDDGSDPVVEVPELGALKVTVLRHDQPHGPGVARNRGLERVTSTHVLFFDSDDELTPALADLWHDLMDQHFDF